MLAHGYREKAESEKRQSGNGAGKKRRDAADAENRRGQKIKTGLKWESGNEGSGPKREDRKGRGINGRGMGKKKR